MIPTKKMSLEQKLENLTMRLETAENKILDMSTVMSIAKKSFTATECDNLTKDQSYSFIMAIIQAIFNNPNIESIRNNNNGYNFYIFFMNINNIDVDVDYDESIRRMNLALSFKNQIKEIKERLNMSQRTRQPLSLLELSNILDTLNSIKVINSGYRPYYLKLYFPDYLKLYFPEGGTSYGHPLIINTNYYLGIIIKNLRNQNLKDIKNVLAVLDKLHELIQEPKRELVLALKDYVNFLENEQKTITERMITKLPENLVLDIIKSQATPLDSITLSPRLSTNLEFMQALIATHKVYHLG